jgi:hypothetical protein
LFSRTILVGFGFSLPKNFDDISIGSHVQRDTALLIADIDCGGGGGGKAKDRVSVSG